MAFSEDESGDDLHEREHDDYMNIPELDRYEQDMLDDRPLPMGNRREMSARQRAEEAMAARDAVVRHRPAEGSSKRGPRALEQVKANRVSNIELERLGGALKCSPAVLSRAEGFLRKAYTGTHCLGGKGPQFACLPAACLEIASRVCKKPIGRDQLLSKAGMGEKDLPNYSRLRREVSVLELCTEFKCNAIKASVRQALEAYKRQFWASLHEDRRQDADFSRPVFAIAALYMTADKNKNLVKLPAKNELLKAGDVQEDEFKQVLAHMRELAKHAASSKVAEPRVAASTAAGNPPGVGQAPDTQQESAGAGSCANAARESPKTICAAGVAGGDIPQGGQLLGALELPTASSAAAHVPVFGAAMCSAKKQASGEGIVVEEERIQAEPTARKRDALKAQRVEEEGARQIDERETADRRGADGMLSGVQCGGSAPGEVGSQKRREGSKSADMKEAPLVETKSKMPELSQAEGVNVCVAVLDSETRGSDPVLATPARADKATASGLQGNTASGKSTVRKVDTRRLLPSAAQRLSTLCSVGVKRKAPNPGVAMADQQRAGIGSTEPKMQSSTHAEYCTVVASDGKPAAGSKKKQRKEEEAAAKALENERRAGEYAQWRAAQMAELELKKSKKVCAVVREQESCSSTADPSVAAQASHADTESPSGTACTAAPGKQLPHARQQASLLDFVRSDASKQRECAQETDDAQQDRPNKGPEGGGRESCAGAREGSGMRERLALAAEARMHAGVEEPVS